MKRLLVLSLLLLFPLNAFALSIDLKNIPKKNRAETRKMIETFVEKEMRGKNPPQLQHAHLIVKSCKISERHPDQFKCKGTLSFPISAMPPKLFKLPKDYITTNGIVKTGIRARGEGKHAIPNIWDIIHYDSDDSHNKFGYVSTSISDKVVITSPLGNIIHYGRNRFRFDTKGKRTMYVLFGSTGSKKYSPIWNISYNKENDALDNASKKDRQRLYKFWDLTP